MSAADFVFLQRTTPADRGEPVQPPVELEEAGLVEIEKKFLHKKPNMNVALTVLGRARIADHWDQMDRVRRLSDGLGRA